jgi:hypothetical protein
VISVPPPQVVDNIFRWNVALTDSFGGLEESHDFLLIRHHWFEVASRTPELWNFWGNNLEDWEKHYLRSRVGASLNLVLDGSTHNFIRKPEGSGSPTGTIVRRVIDTRPQDRSRVRDKFPPAPLFGITDQDLIPLVTSPIARPLGTSCMKGPGIQTIMYPLARRRHRIAVLILTTGPSPHTNRIRTFVLKANSFVG